MNELHGRRQPKTGVVLEAMIPAPDQTGGGDREKGPQTLAASIDQVFGQSRNDADRTLHAIDDQGVDPRHVGRGQRHQALDRSGGPTHDGVGCIQEP